MTHHHELFESKPVNGKPLMGHRLEKCVNEQEGLAALSEAVDQTGNVVRQILLKTTEQRLETYRTSSRATNTSCEHRDLC